MALEMNATLELTLEEASAEPYAQFYDNARFITGMILMPMICVLGLTGNVLTLIVLQQKNMLTSTNVLLKALTVADTFKLLNDALYFIDLVLLQTHPVAGNSMMGHVYPFSHYVFNESVLVTAWLTVCVAVERYINVCHPAKAREICTVERARVVSVIVFISMSVLAIPSALRYQKIVVTDQQKNSSHYEIALSTLGRNTVFMTGHFATSPHS